MSNNNYLSLYSIPEKIDKIEKSIILCGDSLEAMKILPEKSIDLVFTSPPYAGNFREYSEHGDPRDLGQLDTKEFVDRFIPYAKEIDRLLKHENGGVFILNIGEKYQDGFASLYPERLMFEIIDKTNFKLIDKVPWIKCLSSNTHIYAKTKKRIGPMMIKDLIKLNPEEVKIWDGDKWNQVFAWEKSKDNHGLEITLSNGCSVSSTNDHKFILENENIVEAHNLNVGDKLLSSKTPNYNDELHGSLFDNDIGWLVGLYLAEGSKLLKRDCVRFSLNKDEKDIQNRVLQIGKKINADCSIQKASGNGVEVRMYGKHIEGIIDFFINGKSSHTKGLSFHTWKMQDNFLMSILKGYLEGDGGKQNDNNKYYSLGFCRNYNLRNSLIFLAARLKLYCKIEPCFFKIKDKKFKSFKGWINLTEKNRKNGFTVKKIKKSKAKNFWTISLSEKPNRICLANGLTVKNCDPFPNKRTRVGTLAWEHIFVFGSHPKLINKNYNYLKSPYRATSLSISNRKDFKKLRKQTKHEMNDAQCYNDIGAADRNYVVSHHNMMTFDEYKYIEEHYVVSPTQNFEGSKHKAQMPIHLAEYFIGGYSKENQVILDPFGGSGTTAAVSWRLNRDFIHIDLMKDNCEITEKRIKSIPKRKDLFNFYGIEENKVSKLEEVKSKTKCNKIF